MRYLKTCMMLVLALSISPILNAQFEDVTAAVGLTSLYNSAPSDAGVAWGDYNNDGWVDLYVPSFDGNKGVYLFKNNSGASFSQPFTAASGNFNMYWSGIFVDYDNDGDLDIYSSQANSHLVRNNSNGASFTDVTNLLQTYSVPNESGAAADFNGDGKLDFFRGGWQDSYYGPFYDDALFMQQPDGNFVITWTEEGGGDIHGARGISAADFDEDFDMDVHVCNYSAKRNFLFLNDGTGDFAEVGEEYGLAGWGYSSGIGNSSGAAWGDLDNDGHLDQVVANVSKYGTTDQTKFHRNLGPEGDWKFDVMLRVSQVDGYISPALADIDNDGDIDVFFTTIYENGQGGVADQGSRLYINNGNWDFAEDAVGYNVNFETKGYQAAWADYDNDGDMDLFVAGRLMRNNLNNGNHWLKIKLVGLGSINRDAIGAQVRIQLGDEILTRQVENTTGWYNQNDPTLHFGLGSNTDPVDVEIRWPNGQISVVRDVAVDQKIMIDSYCPAEDATNDCNVDAEDFEVLATNWLEDTSVK